MTPKVKTPGTPGTPKVDKPPLQELKPVAPVGLSLDTNEEIFKEDFTDVEEGGFPVVSEGYHHAKVIDFEKGESQAGNAQYVWQFRVTAGDSKDIEIRYWSSLLPQARWRTAETLDAVGIEAMGSIASFTKRDIVGKPCILEVIHQIRDNKVQHKVKKVWPPDADSKAFAEHTPM